MWELWVKIYLGQNEDCSPEDSISDSSEKLLQGGGGREFNIVILVKGEFTQSNTYLYERLPAGHKELMSPWWDLVLF